MAAMTALALALAVAAPDRPLDVWAFRCVLDDRPRILALALSKDLWLAYDATHCSLVQAWTGGVRLEGSVFTAEHGPQPTSYGKRYYAGPADRDVWRLNGKTVRPRFRGYRFVDGQCRLRYQFADETGWTFDVYETPEREQRGGDAVLERKFSAPGLPKGARLDLEVGNPDGLWAFGKVTHWANRLHINGEGTTTLRLDTASAKPFGEAPPDGTPGPQSVVKGATYRAFQLAGPVEAVPTLVPNQTPNVSKVVASVDLEGGEMGLEDHFVAHVTGWIVAPSAGRYRFRLSSDDGSRLTIGGRLVVDHDGLHASTPKVGEVELAAGRQEFLVEYFENEGGQELRLEWSPPGSDGFAVVPESALETQGGEVHVTSPGTKRTMDRLWPERPGDGAPLVSVHPSFDLSPARPRGFEPKIGGIDFLPDGRMVVCCWEPEGGVYVLDGVQDGVQSRMTAKRAAFGLAEPLGIKVVNGDVYVLQKQELTRLIDHDKDGTFDEYDCVANGWGVTSNFHEFAFGLEYERGHFYGSLAIAIDPGGRSTKPQEPDRGKTIKIDPKTGRHEFVASGLRTPNGIGRGVGGKIFITDNQGDWLPASKLLLLQPGAFYGNRSVDFGGTQGRAEAPPVVWLPQGEIGNSPSQPAPLELGPYKGQMIHADVTHGGLKRVMVETVKGVAQGCVFRFVQGLEAGTNRVCWGPDGALYVGGIGSTGNWGQAGKERFGLQRLKWNGAPVFDLLAVRARANGFEVEFTEPVAPGSGRNLDDYTVRQWRYVPTEAYGGPKVDETAVPVRSATFSRNRRKVFLELEGLNEGHVVHLRVSPAVQAASGRSLWATEAWYTLNRLPDARGEARKDPGARPGANQLSPEEAAQGFELLFDGKSLEGWQSRQGGPPSQGWAVVDGSLTFVPGAQGGDIRTQGQFADFDLRFDWRASPGGNSGVFYRCSTGPNREWLADGAEYQILDDAGHPDGRSRLTSAAAFYAVYESPAGVVRPGGVWNEGRIVCRGPQVEHWLNGRLVVSYTTGSEDWKRRKAATRFAGTPYGTGTSGHIVLQDHGDLVAYRNVRLKRLD